MDLDAIEVLNTALEDLTDESVEALFEIIAELDPLATDEGGPKWTPAQRDVIADMQAKYRTSGLASG